MASVLQSDGDVAKNFSRKQAEAIFKIDYILHITKYTNLIIIKFVYVQCNTYAIHKTDK